MIREPMHACTLKTKKGHMEYSGPQGRGDSEHFPKPMWKIRNHTATLATDIQCTPLVFVTNEKMKIKNNNNSRRSD